MTVGLIAAAPQDVPLATDLVRRAFADYSARMGATERWDLGWLGDAMAAGDLYLTFDAGVPRGLVAFEQYPDQRLWEIRLLAVDPDLQGQGRGASLLRAAERLARDAGMDRVTLHTAQMMDHLLRFYAAQGYLVARTGPHPDGKDSHIRVFFTKDLRGPAV